MKVLHICTQTRGGAEKAAVRLHLGLREIGLDSKMLVLHKDFQEENIIPFSENFSLIQRLINKIRNKNINLEFNLYKKAKPKNSSFFSDNRTIYHTYK